MSKKQHFINEFEVKGKMQRIQTYVLEYDLTLSRRRRFGYKVASQVSRKLTDEMHVPVASIGFLIVTEDYVSLPKALTLTLKLDDGLPREIRVGIKKGGIVGPKNEIFLEAAKKLLNRKIDLLMTSQNFLQDGRGFYEEVRAKDLGKQYTIRRGIWIATHAPKEGFWTVIADPSTQVRAKLNLKQALQLELDKRGLTHWKEAQPLAAEINKVFKSKAYSLRSRYLEPRVDEPEYNTYRFIGFDFQHGLQKDSDPANPVNFHSAFNRRFEMDQPEVIVWAHGGHIVRHIPELLEENPSLSVLKRFGVSDRAQAQSLLSAADRYYETTQLLKPLVDANLVDQRPIEVGVKDFSPVRIVMERGYIELRNNLDFQKFFDKEKLLKKPNIKTIHVFSVSEDEGLVKKLLNGLSDIFKDFSVPFPDVNEHVNGPNKLEDFRNFVLEIAEKENFSVNDLALVVFGFEDEDIEDITYNSLKRESLSHLFPVQFVNRHTLSDKFKDLRKDVINPLFLQIVAKCRGQPYGLQPGFMPEGTVIMAIDRYRDPFVKDAPLATAVVLFDNNGNYVCSGSSISKGSEEDVFRIAPLMKSCINQLAKKTGRKEWRLILFLEEFAGGTKEEELQHDAEDCAILAKEIKASYALITANKNSHLRLYAGDPSDELSAERTSPFTVAMDMPDPSQFLVVSTEPIISREKAREYGTPRPILYKVVKSELIKMDELKDTAAKIVVWLCRHSWVSPSSTRLPAPLYFANKLSRLVAATGVIVSPEASEAPLFL
jgi:hypothetical protein